MKRLKLVGLFIVLLLSIFAIYSPVRGETQIIEVCPQRITFSLEGYSFNIPYCRNYPLGEVNASVERAVIVIHGTSRTADSYYSYVLNAALQAGADTKTIILAPQFLIEQDIVDFNLGDEILYWTNQGWKQGDKSLSTTQHPRAANLSSFSAVDTILERLADRNKFPNLTKIVIAGHSAGAQFVNRFAAGSPMQQVLAQQYGIQLRYVVANPSSYLYFNGERRVKGTLDQFAIPDVSSCTDYNQYKYGLENLNSYMALSGSALIKNQYPEREVIYLLGNEDNDPNDSDLDKTCPAVFQGIHRLERGQIYYNYIQYLRQKIG